MDDQDRRKEIQRHVRNIFSWLRKGPGDQSADIAVRHASREMNDMTRSERRQTWHRLRRGQLSRRNFLKLAGASVAGAVLASEGASFMSFRHKRSGPTGYATINLGDEGLSKNDDLSNYLDKVQDNTVIEVPQGAYRFSGGTLTGKGWELVAPDGATLRVDGSQKLTLMGEGYNISGFVFDISNKKRDTLGMATEGENYTVSRIGWHGRSDGDAPIRPSTNDGANAVFDTLYIGDGRSAGARGAGIIASKNRHQGHIDLRRAHVAHFTDNGLYGVSSSGKRNQGSYEIENSFFHANNISNIRVGTEKRESHVRNNTVVMDDTVRSGNSGLNQRAVWAYYGTVIAENNCVKVSGPGNPNAFVAGDRYDQELIERNNTVGPNVDCSIPEGAPQSAKDISSAGGVTGKLDAGVSSGSTQSTKGPC